MYGEMTFTTTPKWYLNDSSLRLLDRIKEGRLATIYRATWTRRGEEIIVAAKMLKGIGRITVGVATKSS